MALFVAKIDFILFQQNWKFSSLSIGYDNLAIKWFCYSNIT